MTIKVNEEQDFHVVLNGNVVALSLNALDMAYQDDLINEGTLIWQEGFAEWTRLDVLLAALEEQDGPAEPAAPADPGMYSVLVAPGEVKQMSLDLLADAYRFDVIDDDTLVWQPGYTEWIPLSVLLGAPEEHVSLAPSLPPPRAVAPASAPPSRAALPAPSLPPSLGYGAGPSYASGPSSSRPAYASAPPPSSAPLSSPPRSAASYSAPPYSAAPSSTAPSSVAPNSAAYSAPAYTASVPPVAAARSFGPSPNSTMPAAFMIPERPRTSPWFGRGLVAVAAMGALVVAHRNGLTQTTAESLDQTAGLGELEAKMGGTGIDTSHGLAKWLGETSARYQLDELSETQPVPEDTAVAVKPAQAEEVEPGEAEKPAAADAAGLPEKKQESAAPAQAEPPPAVDFASSLSGKPAAAPAVNRSKPKAYRPAAPAKRKQGAGDPNDPMNGDL